MQSRTVAETPRRSLGPVAVVALLTATLALSASSCERQGTNQDDPKTATEATSGTQGGADRAQDEAPEGPAGPRTELDAAGGEHRIVAIGDVHGDLSATKDALRAAHVIDDDGHWAAGDAVLVQTGDVLDRGNDEPEIMALLERLQGEAAEAGGEVVLLNGNHELMNAQGDMRYVTPEGMEDYNRLNAEMVEGAGSDTLNELPARGGARIAAFRPGSWAAKKLAERDLVAVVDGNVFVHGGVLPRHVEYGIERINAETKDWLAGQREAPPEIVQGEDSPVWVRHYSQDPDAEDCTLLERTLTGLDAERMIVGHTVQENGISAACDGQVWRIDTGMSAHYGGRVQALEIVGDDVRVLEGSTRE